MNSAREGGNLLSQAHQLSGRVFSRVLKQHGIDELNPSQGRILYELWKEDELTQTELAARTKLDKSTLALMLDRLAAAGQIERIRDPSDSRKRIVRTTESNRKLHRAYAAASEEMTEIFYRGIDRRESDDFENTLRKIIANLMKGE
ncbi:MAG: MarR family transcriptional regulator [Spirochaetales bacterium]|nr:MarR family transcriptional regulator [Spirochaetales bacterium]